MSRLLKQVYSQNLYVEFRFQSSLRKYDKKPTKKIKCEAYCKHCINHQKRLEESPLRQSKMRFESQSKLRKFYQISLEKRSEKSIISPCKTIKLSKQKAPLSEKQYMNALQMNIYRELLSQEKNGEAVLQKSQENNSSSIQEEVFLNDFEHNSEEQGIKDVNVDEDFNKIQLPEVINIENKVQCSEIIQNQNKNLLHLEQNQEKMKQDEIQKELIIEQQQQQNEILQEKVEIQEKPNEIINQNFIQQIKESNKCELIIEGPIQQKEVIITDNLSQEVFQQSLPIQFEQLLLPNKTSLNSQAAQIIQDNSNQKMIQESFLGESMMDKCLAFQGGRIYVDTSGQNFYISVRVFNKLRRRCSDIDQLTSVLIHQRPYLQSRKEQIKQQLQEYLKTFA